MMTTNNLRSDNTGSGTADDVNGRFVLPAGGQEFSPLVAKYFSPTAAR
jgi:hypothetical protein